MFNLPFWTVYDRLTLTWDVFKLGLKSWGVDCEGWLTLTWDVFK